MVGDLGINYADRRVMLQDRPVSLTDIEHRFIVELLANTVRVLTYQHLQRRVWGADENRDVWPIRTVVSAIRRRLGANSEAPAYIQTEFRVGYSMLRPDGSENRE